MADGPTIDVSDQDESRTTVLDRGRLHRVLNTPQLFAIGFGDVGSSIYYALGVTTLYALGATPLALLFALTGRTRAVLGVVVTAVVSAVPFILVKFGTNVHFLPF